MSGSQLCLQYSRQWSCPIYFQSVCDKDARSLLCVRTAAILDEITPETALQTKGLAYSITVAGRAYIGKGSKGLSRRWHGWCFFCRSTSHKSIVQNEACRRRTGDRTVPRAPGRQYLSKMTGTPDGTRKSKIQIIEIWNSEFQIISGFTARTCQLSCYFLFFFFFF